MKRREFLKTSAALIATGAAGFRLPLANAADYRGRLCVFIQCDGAWDPTSFCDPKVNTPGEPVINHWAETKEIRQAGNIPYAPFAANEAFFDKYHDRMLVINGVDAQTGSHTVGVVHNWSGRNSEGYPTISALVAAHHAPALPIAYLNFGGYSETAGLTRYTRLDNPDLLRSIAYPRGDGEWDWHEDPEDSAYFSPEDWAALRRLRTDTVERLSTRSGLLPAEAKRLDHYRAAFESSEGLRAFADAIPSEEHLEQPVATRDGRSEIRRQAQLTVLAFKTGVSVAADFYLDDFDTHDQNDPGQSWLLANLADGVDYLWEYAEQHGIADRLFVMIGSDFGRTNHYNSNDGKDHWPIGSYVIMEKDQRWTNRVVGETDALHFAQRINPSTLKRDDANGTIIYPKHVHKALRGYLGIDGSAGAVRFPFNNTEDFAFFAMANME